MTGGCWPSHTEHMLLRAATHRDPAVAQEACARWWRATDLDEIDHASYRLIPQLYNNLRRHDLPLPDQRIRGIHRQSWYRNQLQFRAIGETLSTLQAAGIDTLILKGAPLAVLYYEDPGARPMNDVDVVVSESDIDRAVRLLHHEGWTPQRRVDEPTLRFAHSVPLYHEKGWELDVHWLPSSTGGHHDAHALRWEAALPFTLGGVETKALDPADELLVTFAHGLQWNALSSIRWLVDATLLIQKAEVDWDRLLIQSASVRESMAVRLGLEGVHRLLDAPVPDWVLERARRAPVSWWERVEQAARERPWSDAWGTATRSTITYMRSRRGEGVVKALAGLPAYVAWRLGVEHPREFVPALLAYGRRLRERREDVGVEVQSQRDKTHAGR